MDLAALLSKTQEATPRFEPRRPFIKEDMTPLHKAVQAEGVSFISRAAIDESPPMARKELSKEPAWQAAEDLPDIPKMLYQLAGECGVSSQPYCRRLYPLTPASDTVGIVVEDDGQGRRHV